MKNAIQNFLARRKVQRQLNVQEFMHQHRDLIIMVADPKTDEITVGFRDKLVKGHIKSARKGRAYVLAQLMRESQFETGFDGLMVALLDVLKVNLRLPSFNQLAQILDGALFNISKTLRKERSTTQAAPPSGAVKSPVTVDAAGRASEF